MSDCVRVFNFGLGFSICRHSGGPLHFVGDRNVGFLGEGSSTIEPAWKNQERQHQCIKL